MANHSLPTASSNYTNVLSELDGRLDDLAVGLDPAVTTATNVPTNSIRWSSSINRWQKWNGTAWVELAMTYALTGLSTIGNVAVGGTLQVIGAATLSGTVSTNSIGPSTSQQHTLPAVPSDTIALLAAPQELANKIIVAPVLSGSVTGTYTLAGTPTIIAPTINGGSAAGLTSFAVRNGGTGVFDMGLSHNGVLTANRTLTLNLNDAARTVSLAGNLNFAGSFTTSGAYAVTLTATAATNVTLPTTGTLSTLSGAETLTNKTIGLGSSWSGNAIPVANGGTGGATASAARANLNAQETLVSGTNIKTINGVSVLGTGDLAVGSPIVQTQTLTSGSGTWSKPTSGGYQWLQIEMWAAGGSGGRSAYGAGGGGGGAYFSTIVPLSYLAASESYTVGAGGAVRTSNGSGNSGGNTSFTLTNHPVKSGVITADGGAGGGYGASNSTASGGAAGVGYQGTQSNGASGGGNGVDGSSAVLYGGAGGGGRNGSSPSISALGGASVFGGDGGNAGQSGAVPGGGGGGQVNGNSGAGGAGQIRLTWW